MRIQPTKIEQLDRQHEGLRVDVDMLLDKGATLEEIQKLLASKHGEQVSINTISNYKQRRWLVARLRMKELQETFQAVKEELGEAAVSESTQARLFELLDQAMRNGAALDPEFLLKEQRLWAQHAVNVAKIETEKKKLELQIEQSRKAIEEATNEAKDKIRTGQQLTLEDINRIRERTFGAGEPAARPPA